MQPKEEKTRVGVGRKEGKKERTPNTSGAAGVSVVPVGQERAGAGTEGWRKERAYSKNLPGYFIDGALNCLCRFL